MLSLLRSLWCLLTGAVEHLIGQWDRFWFTPMDPFALGVLRLLSGSMLVYTHLVWGLRLEEFFGPDGWQDELLVKVQLAESTAFSFWWYVPADWLFPVHGICLTLLVLYTLGVFTRVTSIAAFLIVISYASRAINANFGLDQINTLLTFYLMLGPSGACLSVDSLWRRRRNGVVRLEKRASACLATRLIQVHMCLVYLFAGISKLKGDAWWDGSAIWMAAANAEYQTGDLTWLAWYPWLGELITHVTILWEVSFCVLVWNRGWRPIVLLLGTLMHLGIGAYLGMWTFGLVMIFTYVSFLSPEMLRCGWEWVLNWINGTKRSTDLFAECQPIADHACQAATGEPSGFLNRGDGGSTPTGDSVSSSTRSEELAE